MRLSSIARVRLQARVLAAPTVLLQDLATDGPPVDVTSQVSWQNNTLLIPGTVIDHVGLAGRSSPDDASPPGLVLVFGQ
jgi:hypothetical protein